MLWLAGWLMRGWVLSRVREENAVLSDGIRVEIVRAQAYKVNGWSIIAGTTRI